MGLERFIRKNVNREHPSELPTFDQNERRVRQEPSEYDEAVDMNFEQARKRIDAAQHIEDLILFVRELAEVEGGKGYLFECPRDVLVRALQRYTKEPTEENLASISRMCGLQERVEKLLPTR